MGLFSFGRSVFDKYSVKDIEKVAKLLEHEDEVLRLQSQIPQLREEAQAALKKRIEQIQSDMSDTVHGLALTSRQVREIKTYLRKLQDDFEVRKYGKI